MSFNLPSRELGVLLASLDLPVTASYEQAHQAWKTKVKHLRQDRSQNYERILQTNHVWGKLRLARIGQDKGDVKAIPLALQSSYIQSQRIKIDALLRKIAQDALKNIRSREKKARILLHTPHTLMYDGETLTLYFTSQIEVGMNAFVVPCITLDNSDVIIVDSKIEQIMMNEDDVRSGQFPTFCLGSYNAKSRFSNIRAAQHLCPFSLNLDCTISEQTRAALNMVQNAHQKINSQTRLTRFARKMTRLMLRNAA